jgi:GMP synthase (glutamine-hydrolysing)
MSHTIDEKILVLDFGSQYSQLIARRIRELNVYCELHPFNMPADEIRAFDPKGIVLSGGPSSVLQNEAPMLDATFFDHEIPTLGICYGMQLTTQVLGGEVEHTGKREYGHAKLEILENSDLFKGFDIGETIPVWMSHGDRIGKMPKGFGSIAASGNSPVAAMANKARHLYCVQFHPEVSHTPRGMEILKNFIFGICGCRGLWTMTNFIETTISDVKEKVGSDHVICALSGGVDSSVVSVLLNKAIGNQLTCIFVNNGVLRKNEAERVRSVFIDHLGINLIYVDATERFLGKLAGVTDPEEKRKIIGNEFISIF